MNIKTKTFTNINVHETRIKKKNYLKFTTNYNVTPQQISIEVIIF